MQRPDLATLLSGHNANASGDLLLNLGVHVDADVGSHPGRKRDCEVDPLTVKSTALLFAAHRQIEVESAVTAGWGSAA